MPATVVTYQEQRGISAQDGVTLAERKIQGAAWGTAESSGGGSQAGAVIIRKFSIAYNTAGLEDGHLIYTPAIGEAILDLWVRILTSWNGTTPLGDVGTVAGGGVFTSMLGPLDMSHHDNPSSAPFGLARNVADFRTSQAVSMGTTYNSSLYQVSGADVNVVASATGSGESGIPGVSLGDAILAWVTQDGTLGDSSPGATQGAADIYIASAQPV